MQFCTAIAAFVGTFFGLVAKQRHEGLERVLVALTTGGFLYVAAVSVLPELLAGKAPSWGQAAREVGGVVGGIALMHWVAMGEGH
jgi:zinc transporter ZupT